MVFNSYQFYIFFPIVLVLYYILPAKLRWFMLLMVSYFFYMCWNVKHVVLLVYVTGITYVGALLVHRLKDGRLRKTVFLLALLFSFSTLFLYKYSDFIINNWNQLIAGFTGDSSLSLVKPWDLLLPMGISFYTFQAVSYLTDVYRKEIVPEKNPLRYALFVSFFPQLVAGPIERSKNLMGQLKEVHPLSYANLKIGGFLLLWGYFQKLVVADKAAILVDEVYNHYTEYGALAIIIATVLFAFQIYCDFSGYTLIAMGCAKMLGFQLMNNFDTPYLACSVSEFWRRWHISLTSWFKDYVYIPLGGNRKGTLRKYGNKLLVFLLSGLWHGAEWSFVVWGGLNGIFQIGEELIEAFKKRKDAQKKQSFSFGKCLVTFLLVDFTWLFFRAGNMNTAIGILRQVGNGTAAKAIYDSGKILGLSVGNVIVLVLSIGILLFGDIIKYKKIDIVSYFAKLNITLRYAICMVLMMIIMVFGTYGSDVPSTFIYFQF